jgi:hypothetical protein
MSRGSNFCRFLCAVGWILLCASAGGAQNQSGHSLAGRTAVVVAVPESFPYQGAQAVIVRRVNAADHDLILVRPGAVQPQRLAAAVGVLGAVRAHYGDAPTQDMVVRVPEGLPRGRLEEAATWADLLSKSATTHLQPIPGLEHARYIRLYLANHVRAGRAGS